jgi:K+-sensing histidine kinase KdpD
MISVLDRGPGVGRSCRVSSMGSIGYRARAKRGTGMGLKVCKRLVKAQPATCGAQTSDDGGLEVSFTLPVYQEE